KNQKSLGPEFRADVESVNAIGDELRKYAENAKAPEDLVGRMAKDDKLAEQLFGKPLPQEVKDLIGQHNAGANIDWDEAEKMLYREMTKRGQKLEVETNAAYEAYAGTLHEKEAHYGGDQVREHGQMAGGKKGVDSPQVRRDASIGGDDIDTSRLDLES